MTRGDCEDAARPCVFVSCKYNLYLDVDVRTGTIKYNFPDIEPDELEHSCALDIADEGGTILDRIAEVMNLTRERARQIEEKAFLRLMRDENINRMKGDL